MPLFVRILVSGTLVALLWSSNTFAQSAFIPLNDDYYHLIDRLEIKRGKFSEGFHSNMKPFERRAVVALTDSIRNEFRLDLTSIDRATIEYIRNDSREWVLPDSLPANTVDDFSRIGSLSTAYKRKNRTFFSHPADLFSLHTKDVDLHVNFATNNYVGRENNTQTGLWFTGRGVEIRGMINKKLGFYTFVSDNQGTFPKYVRNYTERYNMPAEGLAKTLRRTGVDFLSARGYITFRPLKSINIQFGHDRNFIGSGYRSMLLSDNSSPYLFLRIDTHLGKFQYTNLWSSMINYQNFRGRDLLRSKKYSAMHHLSVNLTDRLNIGVFEAVIFSRDSSGIKGYDLNYLSPVIFYRFVESYLGSQDNALLGFNFKWLIARRASVYGQFMLDEFLTKYYFSKSGSWTKKYGTQIGIKYVDAFGIGNLDVQAEYNMAQPYTYSHQDGGRNYTHFRQPLAHPLGANFNELLLLLRYKITPRLSTYGTVMWSRQGIDRAGLNYGGNLLLDYDTRVSDFGNSLGQGVPLYTRFGDLRLSYMLAHNLFVEGRVLLRREESPRYNVRQSTSMATMALRYNMPYRQQTF